jgi:hypothetical protein
MMLPRTFILSNRKIDDRKFRWHKLHPEKMRESKQSNRFCGTILSATQQHCLEAIIFKALAKDQGERYQDASQLKRELQVLALGV